MTEIVKACPVCGERYEITERTIRTNLRSVPVIECAGCGAVMTVRRLLRKRTPVTERDIDELIELWNWRSE
jgi:uncharacterized Zn finger protein